MSNNPKIEVEVGAEIKDLKKKLNQVEKELSNTGKSFNQLNEFAVGAMEGIAAAFSIGAIVTFGKAVLDTTAKFQKFEAVLSNTLGSESAAQQALIQISEFASRTPFQVDELTSAFVKLANQGFKPTLNELRSLGDLASSTGKSFDQLAEAVIDAQVGEFERLKEFGIRASVSGDQVAFTFKGVETQVKNTNEAIRQYVLSLGDAEGVSGAMVKVSETLGGKISNLGDNIEQLKLSIGNQTSGIFATSIDWLNQFVSLATLASKSVAQIRDEVGLSKIGSVIASNREEVLRLADAYAKIDPTATKQANLAKAIADVSRNFREAAEGGEAFKNQSYSFDELNQIIEGFNKLSIELLTITETTKVLTSETKKLKRTFEDTSDLSRFLEIASLDRKGSFFQGVEGQIGVESGAATTAGIFQTLPNQSATEEIKTFADLLEKVEKNASNMGETLVGVFSGLGGQIASSMNISNQALEGFVSTLLTNTPKIISAIIKTAQANKLAMNSNIQGAKKGALANGIFMATESGKSLGPIGLALLPVLIGGAVALINKAFGGSGGGGVSGIGTSGISQGTTFSSQGTATGFNRALELKGQFRIDGMDLVYVIDRARQSQN